MWNSFYSVWERKPTEEKPTLVGGVILLLRINDTNCNSFLKLPFLNLLGFWAIYFFFYPLASISLAYKKPKHKPKYKETLISFVGWRDLLLVSSLFFWFLLLCFYILFILFELLSSYLITLIYNSHILNV